MENLNDIARLSETVSSELVAYNVLYVAEWLQQDNAWPQVICSDDTPVEPVVVQDIPARHSYHV